MIPDAKLPDLIKSQFPNVALLFIESTLKTPQAIMHAFAGFTKDMISVGSIKEVKHCFDFVNALYRNGSNEIKNAIENTYVYFICSAIDMSPSTLREQLSALLPGKLMEMKKHLQHTSGI